MAVSSVGSAVRCKSVGCRRTNSVTDRQSRRAATSNGSTSCDASHTEYSSSAMPRNCDRGRCSLSSDSCQASMKSSICSAATFPSLQRSKKDKLFGRTSDTGTPPSPRRLDAVAGHRGGNAEMTSAKVVNLDLTVQLVPCVKDIGSSVPPAPFAVNVSKILTCVQESRSRNRPTRALHPIAPTPFMVASDEQFAEQASAIRESRGPGRWPGPQPGGRGPDAHGRQAIPPSPAASYAP